MTSTSVRLPLDLIAAATAATGLPPRAAIEALAAEALQARALAAPHPPTVEEQLAGLCERVARLEAGYTALGGG